MLKLRYRRLSIWPQSPDFFQWDVLSTLFVFPWKSICLPNHFWHKPEAPRKKTMPIKFRKIIMDTMTFMGTKRMLETGLMPGSVLCSSLSSKRTIGYEREKSLKGECHSVGAQIQDDGCFPLGQEGSIVHPSLTYNPLFHPLFCYQECPVCQLGFLGYLLR